MDKAEILKRMEETRGTSKERALIEVYARLLWEESYNRKSPIYKKGGQSNAEESV